MNDQNEIPQVRMTNRKKELMEAYEAMKQQLKGKEKQVLDAEKARKQGREILEERFED
jgi:hypothetical protein